MAYGTTSLVAKQSCSKKSNVAPFVLLINHKPVIACYLLQYDISSSFHIFSLFLSIKGSSNITAKQTETCNRNSDNINRSSDTYMILIRNRVLELQVYKLLYWASEVGVLHRSCEYQVGYIKKKI